MNEMRIIISIIIICGQTMEAIEWPRCCPNISMIIIGTYCTDTKNTLFEYPVHEIGRDKKVSIENLTTYHTSMVCQKGLLVDTYILLQDGRLLSSSKEEYLNAADFCVDPHKVDRVDNKTVVIAYTCRNDPMIPSVVGNAIRWALCVTSAVILGVTLLMCTLLPSVWPEHAYFVINYIICMLAQKIFWMITEFTNNTIVFDYGRQFWIIAALSWTTAINADLFWILRNNFLIGFPVGQIANPKYIFTVVCWGFSIIIATTGEYFSSWYSMSELGAAMVYFLNLILLVLSGCYFHKIRKSYPQNELVTLYNCDDRLIDTVKEMLIFSVQLYSAMVIPWLTEVFTNLNLFSCLHGVFVLLFLVSKKEIFVALRERIRKFYPMDATELSENLDIPLETFSSPFSRPS